MPTIFILPLVFVPVAVIFAVAVLLSKVLKRKSDGQTANRPQPRVEQPVRQSGSSAYDKHRLHVEDAHKHGHVGKEEHYDEIVGSLGDINDEGCADLDGVRFVAHDLAYDVDGEDATFDRDKLARALVLGDVLNSPRFKHPYGK